MHLTKNDMIDWVREGFKDHGYKSAINKRLCFGFNILPLTYYDCISLNSVVKELDNNMLIMNDISNEIVTINYSTVLSTTTYVYFRYANKIVNMCVDDEKIGVKIEINTIQEKEF